MRHDKCAVFQIANNDGTARLICVPSATFADGARLETELREYGGGCLQVSFLGRFDQIQSAGDLSELLGLLLEGAAPLLRAS
jgi:hypothetical protein